MTAVPGQFTTETQHEAASYHEPPVLYELGALGALVQHFLGGRGPQNTLNYRGLCTRWCGSL